MSSNPIFTIGLNGNVFQHGGTIEVETSHKLKIGECISFNENGEVIPHKRNDISPTGIVAKSPDKNGRVHILLTGGFVNLELQKQLEMISKPGKAILGLFSEYPEVVAKAKELIWEQENGK